MTSVSSPTGDTMKIFGKSLNRIIRNLFTSAQFLMEPQPRRSPVAHNGSH